MNIATYTLNESINQGLDAFISSELNMIEEQQKQCRLALTNYAIEFLDRVFPLSQGSHKQVASYVVYYRHLLAFFPDGSQAGLADTSQFKGLCGHKEQPEALLLKANGRFVEVTFNPQGEIGKTTPAHIDDIQIEANDYNQQNSRQWFSMLKVDRNMMLARATQSDFSLEGKTFTSAHGEEITL